MSNGQQLQVNISEDQFWLSAYWGALGVGAILLSLGLAEGLKDTDSLGFVAAACFLGIVARVVQAEYHHRARRQAGRSSPA